MNITSAKFIKGVVGEDQILNDGTPQIAFIGRSNVGKSSVINSLTKQKNLAISSNTPGRTREINVFLINKSIYFVDLPGYGYAKISKEGRNQLRELIHWYFVTSTYHQEKIIFIIDAEVGPTKIDAEMLRILEEQHKNIVIVANKVDKIKPSQYTQKMQIIHDFLGHYTIVPYS